MGKKGSVPFFLAQTTMKADSAPFFVDPNRSSSLTAEERQRYAGMRDFLVTRGWFDVGRLPEEPPIPDSQRFLLRTPGGNVSLLFRNESGQQSILHHFESPERKATDWWSGRTGPEPMRYVFHGLGLGYSIPPVLELADRGSRFLLVESDPEAFALCLALTDCRRLFHHPNVSVCLCPEPEEAACRTQAWLVATQSSGPSQVRLLVDPPALAVTPLFLRDWLDGLAKRMPQLAAVSAKEIRNGYPYSTHLRENWHFVQNRPGIGRLFGRMSGVPAAIVGAGPGLDRLVPALSEAQERILVLACDTALPALQGAGVRVDIALTVDSTPASQTHYQNVLDRSFLPVFVGGVHPPLLVDFKDRVWLTAIAPFPTADLLEPLPGPSSYLMEKGCLVLNGTVGSAALDLALRLGCGPVFLAGVDLAYCEGRDHAKGTIYDDDTGFQDRQPGLFEVPSVEGGRANTCTSFLASLLGLGGQVEKSETEIYNLSENGAFIRGAKGSEEGLAMLRDLPFPARESPAQRLRMEADLSEREMKRPLWRREVEKGSEGFLIDGRGRLRGTPDAATLTGIATKNLEVLSRTNPPLARSLGETLEVLETGRLANGETCEWLSGKERHPRLAIRGGEGGILTLLPTTDSPWQEIAEWQVGRHSAGRRLVLVLGAGLGFHIQDILHHLGQGKLWVWEPYIDRLRIALGIADWRDVFADNRVRWAVGTGALDLLRRMERENREALYECPVTWRPWVIPAFRSWAAASEREFVDAWLRHFPELHPRPARILLKRPAPA